LDQSIRLGYMGGKYSDN